MAQTRRAPAKRAGRTAKISVSLATIEFKAVGTGTRLLLTETGAFLDGYDDAGSREHGTNFLMDRMGATLERASAGA